MRIDEAPPPPLQMPARPYCPGCRWCTMWPTILVPDILEGENENKNKSVTMTQEINCGYENRDDIFLFTV